MLIQYMKVTGYSLFELLILNIDNKLAYLKFVTLSLLTHIKISTHTTDIYRTL